MNSSTGIIESQAVQALLLAALELTPEERTDFLAQIGSDEVRSKVEALLAQDPDALSALDQPLCELHLPEMVGPYRVVRLLGEGGMGEVYLADSGEGLAAVKVLSTIARTNWVRRFRVERQILATLRHPNVAEVYEDGVTRDGRPYFAMEYVDGTPIDSYCDRNRLSIDDRLGLFRKVCEVVSFAHRRHVIHRDLKPSNILVTTDGEPTLLDFGIAKFLKRDVLNTTFTATGDGQRPMTPDYASPEHVAGEAMTPASDIYSLGVLLYEMLAGRRPYHLRTRDLDRIRRKLRNVEPKRPSTLFRPRLWDRRSFSAETIAASRRETPRSLNRRLRGELDDIVMKALYKDPEKRYPSVEKLSEDVRRYLEEEPVWASRLRGAKQRRTAVGSATFLALAGAAYLAVQRPPAPTHQPVASFPLTLENAGFETNQSRKFGPLADWAPDGGWTFHAQNPIAGREDLGERFAFYAAGAGEIVAQRTKHRFRPEAEYHFSSRAIGGHDLEGRLPYLIGYTEDDEGAISDSFVALAVAVVDLNGIDAWRETEGISYRTGAAGLEIGRRIVLVFGSNREGGESDIWLDEAVLRVAALGPTQHGR